MRVSELRVGTQLMNGRITVTALKRQGAYSEITLSSGDATRTVRLHKTQSIATVLVGVCETVASTGWLQVRPHVVRASDPKWRSQSDGVRASWERPTGDEFDRKRAAPIREAAPRVRADKRY